MIQVARPTFSWSPWSAIEEAWTSKGERAPGLYRIRDQASPEILYIGQTGTSLRLRLGHLKSVYTSSEMPYNDPHTVGPALWAFTQQTGARYEASVCPLDGIDSITRKGLECLAISQYRLEFGHSPRFNFGRMPVGYSKSSGNNAALVAKGMRFRGGPVSDALPCHCIGVPPVGDLAGDPQAPLWCGHAWSPWVALLKLTAPSGNGLYRLRAASDQVGGALIYIGEGKVGSRLRQHAKTATTDSSQGRVFAAQSLECCWVLNDEWTVNQRHELENDLIAAHVQGLSQPPAGQFLG